MKNLISWQRVWPHLVAVIGFMALAILYVPPTLQGKKLNMFDDIQAKGAAREVLQYHEKTGEWSSWTNGMFAGMPAYLVAADYPTSISTKLGQGINKLLPEPANYLLIGMVSAYVLFLVLGTGGWLAALGGIAFAFASFNLISIEAGHVSKVIAIMYAPGVIAGVILAFRQNWLAGAALTALFLSLELYANHVQITYYLGIGILVLVALEGFRLLKEGETKRLIFTLAGLGLAAVLAIGTHTTRLWNAYDYSKETIRGKPELTSPQTPQSAPKQDGLDKDYAFTYSYGIGESLTLLIPNAYGGASSGSLDAGSETYKVLVNRGVEAAAAQNFMRVVPGYWGDQPILGGPVYAGAIVFFLFVLGIFIVKGPLKYWTVSVVALYMIWAWGKNFASVNYLFFDYFPMYNKFRAMTMVLALVQLLMVFLGILALNTIVQRKIDWKDLQRPFLISLGITGGLSFLLALMPGVFFSFQGANDQQTLAYFTQMTGDQTFAQQIMTAVLSDRKSMMQGDALRTMIFILLAAGLVWLWVKNRIKPVLFYGLFIAITIIDMFGVDKRYLNNDDFVGKFAAQGNAAPSPADEQILKDPDPDYKVLDASTSPFQSAEASYFHKSLGGYHAAKMRRYQELFERQIARQNPNPGILNMLNTKYIISADQQGNKIAQPNPQAFGHAWFVNSYKLVPNADAEMSALDSLKPREEAVVDQRFAEQLKGLSIQPDPAATITLLSYKPNELVYESNSSKEGLAVFSEIYYNVRDEWKVTIDNQPAKMIRADYVLRALRVPAGKHSIRFSFEPVSVSAGSKVDLVSSILLVGLISGAIFVQSKKSTKNA